MSKVIVDTSALLAILFREPEADEFFLAVASAPAPAISAAGFLEAAIRVIRSGVATDEARLDALIVVLSLEIAPVTLSQARIAREAWRRFGKGVHKASLNFGDCLAYALAAERGAPLLFKGEDLPLTDIQAARTF